MTSRKRLNMVLDPKSFASLECNKERHGDPTYTQSIKRAIALTYFIIEKEEKGAKFYIPKKDNDRLQELIIV